MTLGLGNQAKNAAHFRKPPLTIVIPNEVRNLLKRGTLV
jgi:hypothetical protein